MNYSRKKGIFNELKWIYGGAFERLIGPGGGGGVLKKNFSKIQIPGVLPGGMLYLRFDWYINMASFPVYTTYIEVHCVFYLDLINPSTSLTTGIGCLPLVVHVGIVHEYFSAQDLERANCR